MTKPKSILATGVFDLFHVGHLRYLQYARQQGSYLLVGVVSDEEVLRTKGFLPAIPLAQRMEIIAALRDVDEVRVQPTSTHDVMAASRWIAEWGIDQVVLGGMWQGHGGHESLAALLRPQGINVVYAPATNGISSTAIRHQLATGPAPSVSMI